MSIICLNTKEYTANELLEIMKSAEISQDNNDNAYARLFVKEGHVYKLFDMADPRSDNALSNLVEIMHFSKDFGERIVQPDLLICYNSRIIGYRQPFIYGRPLGYYMLKRDVATINRLFINLQQTLCMLGKNICAGDLHAWNVMVVENSDSAESRFETYLIDADGFAKNNTVCQSHPMEGLPSTPLWFYSSKKKIISSKTTDYASMLNMYGTFLLKREILFCMSPEVFQVYMGYLSTINSCCGFAEALKEFVYYKRCLNWETIANVNFTDLVKASYEHFYISEDYQMLLEELFHE